MALQIEQLLSQIFARVAPGLRTGDPVATSFLQWAGAVQESAVGRWRKVASSGIRCSLRQGNGALPIACEHPAVGACTFCQKPVCLPHAVVAMNGNVACLACMGLFGEVVRERVRARPHVPPPGPAAAPCPSTDAADRKRHLRTLALKDPATWDEVKQQYKKLAQKWHPDHAPPGKREASTRKMIEINAAYQWLDGHMRKAAAA